MKITKVWSKIIRAGVDEKQTLSFSDILKNCNRLALLCVFFSTFYFCFFLVKALYLPLIAISFAIVIFALAIFSNHLKKHLVSSILLLFNTNYCVAFFSIYLGFNSGIHLYLFTSPLIVLSLFHGKGKRIIFISMMTYLINFLVLIFIKKYYKISFIQLDESELEFLYMTNFIFAITILITLCLYFLLNNEKINHLLLAKNLEMAKEIAVRQIAEKFAKTALKEKELLLGEIHHRVKNNLAIISALINLQIENLKDDESKIIFEETKDRIYSMALIHNQLYQNKSFAQIEFAQYINNFCSYLVKSYQTNPNIEIIEKTTAVFLDIKTAIPCALILNELITNAFKHAFKNNGKGKIEVGLKVIIDKQILFYVSDTGTGMDSKQLQATSMGMSLITSLIEQIDGKLEYLNQNGSTFLITFSNQNL
jgi:two-component sensor histidine kinase